MNRIEDIQQHFCCAKCRGHTPSITRAHLPLSGSRFPLRPGRYLVVTCTLCGYTEFYDLAAFADQKETAEDPSREPGKPPTNPFLLDPEKGANQGHV
jgi:predicted nucleic-acid-binding Zn-ribbon protein